MIFILEATALRQLGLIPIKLRKAINKNKALVVDNDTDRYSCS